MRIHRNDVINISVDGIDRRDHPDYVDAYISYAEWKQTGVPLTDAELYMLEEQHPEIAQEIANGYVPV